MYLTHSYFIKDHHQNTDSCVDFYNRLLMNYFRHDITTILCAHNAVKP